MLEILRQHSILYVEDEPHIRDNIIEYLESYFGTVYAAADGAKALESYEKHHPDVMLLDINIPHIDGLSVAKEIRKTDKTVKLVMLTAHTEQEKLLKATELKLTKYIIKPASPKEFKDTMKMLADELSQESGGFIYISDTCRWNTELGILEIDKQPIALSEKSHKLMRLFISKKSELVSYEDIMVTLWEDAFDREISLGSVKNRVSQLRKALPSDCIKSVYAKGYILRIV